MATRKATQPLETAAVAETSEIVETMTTLYTTGVERIAEMQKLRIDLVVKQSGEVIVAWKKIAKAIPGMGSFFFLDLTTSGLEQFAGTQKAAIDMVLGQSRALTEVVKERATSATEAIENAPTLLKQNIEQSIAAQKKALEHSAARTGAAFDRAKETFGIASTSAETISQSFQKGLVSLIESQKELLIFTAKPFATVN